MASFFESLGRLFKGEPVYNESDQAVPMQKNQGIVQSQPTNPQSGPKILPQVVIERWQCIERGTGLHLEIVIQNNSKGIVHLGRIELLGVRDELGNSVRPGVEYEFVLDMPNRPRDTNRKECKLYFKDETGDYFCAIYLIDFEKLSDGSYKVLRFRFLPPIRDV